MAQRRGHPARGAGVAQRRGHPARGGGRPSPDHGPCGPEAREHPALPLPRGPGRRPLPPAPLRLAPPNFSKKKSLRGSERSGSEALRLDLASGARTSLASEGLAFLTGINATALVPGWRGFCLLLLSFRR